MTLLTIIILFEILVKYGILLDDMLCCRRTYRSTMCIKQLALKVPFPKLRFRELDASQRGRGSKTTGVTLLGTLSL